MNPGTARRRTAASRAGIASAKGARTAAVLATLLFLGGSAVAHEPPGRGSVDPYGADGAAPPITIRVEVTYPFAALRDTSRSDDDGPVQVDPYAAATSAAPLVARVELVGYPFAALHDRSSAQVDPYALATLGSGATPSSAIVRYPFAALLSSPSAAGPLQLDPYAAATSGPTQAPTIVIFVYPFHGDGDALGTELAGD